MLGTPGTIDADPWLLALELVEHSAKVTNYLGALSVEHHRAQDAERVARQEAREEIRAEKATERIARQLARKEHERDWLRSDLYRDGIASRDRPYFDEALALAFQHGWITQRGSDLTAGAVPPHGFLAMHRPRPRRCSSTSIRQKIIQTPSCSSVRRQTR